MFQRPFEAASLAPLLVKIVTCKPKPIPEELYSKDLRRLTKKLLHKKPERRPTADELLLMPAVSSKVQATAAAQLISANMQASAGEVSSTSRSSSRSGCSSRSSSCSLPRERQPEQDDVREDALLSRSHSKRQSQRRLCRDAVAFEIVESCSTRTHGRLAVASSKRSKSYSHSKFALPRLDVRPPGILSEAYAGDVYKARAEPTGAAELGMPLLSRQLPPMPQVSSSVHPRPFFRPLPKKDERRCRSRSLSGVTGESGSRSRSRPPAWESSSSCKDIRVGILSCN